MPIPSTIDDLSPTAGSNSPSGSDPPTEGDNYLRALSAIIRTEHDNFTGTTGAALVGFLQDGAGAISITAQEKLRETPSVLSFGADRTGVTSSSAAFSAALAAHRRVRVPSGTYLLTEPLVMSTFGANLLAEGGLGAVTLTIDHVSGHAIVLANGYQRLSGFLVYASTTRAAAATNTSLSGIVIGGSDAGSNYMTNCFVDDVITRFHPGIGLYMGAEGAGTTINQVSSDFNKHHGFAFDDGTIGVSSPTRRNGVVTLSNCRAAENGGNAINLSESNSTCYRFEITQFEALSNVWNFVDIAGLRDAQTIVRAQNIELKLCGWDDSLFANTTTSAGTARAAKAAPSDGFQVMNATTEFRSIANRFLTLTRCAFVRTGADGFAIDDAYSDPGKNIGFRIESGVIGFRMALSSVASYTAVVFSDTAELRAIYQGVEVVLATASGAYFSVNKSGSATIASNAVNAQSSVVYLTGEGGAADDLQAINLSGGSIKVPAGITVTVVNRQAYNITVKNGLSNVFTQTGADVVLGTNQAMSLVSDGTNLYEV
jgi:hypothetical protein